MTDVKGSAGYVAMERVTGKLNGRGGLVRPSAQRNYDSGHPEIISSSFLTPASAILLEFRATLQSSSKKASISTNSITPCRRKNRELNRRGRKERREIPFFVNLCALGGLQPYIQRFPHGHLRYTRLKS